LSAGPFLLFWTGGVTGGVTTRAPVSGRCILFRGERRPAGLLPDRGRAGDGTVEAARAQLGYPDDGPLPMELSDYQDETVERLPASLLPGLGRVQQRIGFVVRYCRREDSSPRPSSPGRNTHAPGGIAARRTAAGGLLAQAGAAPRSESRPWVGPLRASPMRRIHAVFTASLSIRVAHAAKAGPVREGSGIQDPDKVVPVALTPRGAAP
jgi:hypothetical protein